MSVIQPMYAHQPKLKPFKPFKYKGEADINKFEKWIFKVETYFTQVEMDMASRDTVLRVYPLLEGKALQFFQDKVQLEVNSWSVYDIFDGLLDYCFP